MSSTNKTGVEAPHTHKHTTRFTICWHTHSFTEPCPHADDNETSSPLKNLKKLFRRRCTTPDKLVNQHGLCHDCRRTFQRLGLSEYEGCRLVQGYRERNRLFGAPIDLHWILGEDLRGGPGEETTEFRRRPRANSSSVTIWPTFSEETDQGTGEQRAEEATPEPEHQVPVVNDEGFELQPLHGSSTRNLTPQTPMTGPITRRASSPPRPIVAPREPISPITPTTPFWTQGRERPRREIRPPTRSATVRQEPEPQEKWPARHSSSLQHGRGTLPRWQPHPEPFSLPPPSQWKPIDTPDLNKPLPRRPHTGPERPATPDPEGQFEDIDLSDDIQLQPRFFIPRFLLGAGHQDERRGVEKAKR